MTNWPWPLDGVQQWFEGLWNHIWDAVAWASQQVWNLIPYWAREPLQQLYNLFYHQWNNIWNFFSDVKSSIQSALQWVWDNLPSWLRDALDGLYSWMQTVRVQFINFFRDVKGNIIGALQWIWDNIPNWIRDTLSGLYSWMQTVRVQFINFFRDPVGTLQAGWDSIVTGLQTAADSIVTSIEEWAGGVVNSIQKWADSVVSGIETETNSIVSQVEKGFADVRDWADALLHGALSGVAEALGTGLQGLIDWLLKHLIHIGEMIVGAIRAVVDAVGNAIRGIVAWLTDTITGGLMEGSPPAEIERASNVLIETSFNRQLKLIDGIYKSEPSGEETISTAQHLMGLMIAGGAVALSTAIAADQVHPLKNMGWRPTVREIIYWAGIPSVTAAIAVLPASIGLLAPMRYALYERWTPIVPEPTDLIRFAVREVFIEAERQRLIVPPPGDDFFKYMKKHGFSQYWSEAFWASHWVRPTVSQLTQYLYRHDDFAEQWAIEVRLNDVVPYAIPWLQEIIYPPYTRVDVRRMWDMRTITEPEMYTNYRWLGYDDEHAKGMVLWTKVYTALPDLVARWKNGWITIEEVLDELIGYGMPQERAIELMQTKIQVAKEDTAVKERDLTKTDILRLLGITEITPVQAKELLMDLGYDDIEASYLIAIQLDRMVEELKELTTAQILKSYRYEIFNRGESKSKIIEAGWSEAAAEILLQLEDVRKADAQVERKRERDLTRRDILSSISSEFITGQTGYDYLSYLGYSDWEIKLIFKLEGIEWLIGS